MNKREAYFGIVILFFVLLGGWEYQKYMNNKVSMSEPLQRIKEMIEKVDSHIYKIKIHDTNKNKDYIVSDSDDIEEFSTVFNSLKGTIVNTNKKRSSYGGL